MFNGSSIEDEIKSKSQRKREAHAAQKFGVQITSLTATQLNKLALPENLHQAIQAIHSIKSNGARKRQRQYIGKLMRSIDLDHYQALLADLLTPKLADNSRTDTQFVQAFAERLLDKDHFIYDEMREKFVEFDRQHLQQLVRNTQKKQSDEKYQLARIVLVRYLRFLQLI